MAMIKSPQKARISTAMVLCGGLGTRMRPLTNTRPKPLVPFLGTPMLDHILAHLKRAGVERVVVNVHYLAEVLESHLSAVTTPRIMISDERSQLLDTGGGIKKALPLLGNDPIFVHNGDSVWATPSGQPASALDRLSAAWNPLEMDSLLLLVPHIQALGFDGPGDFFINASHQIQRRKNQPSAPFIFAGVSVLNPHCLAPFGDEPFSLTHIWDRASGQGRLFGLVHDGPWFHIGTPAALAEAEEVARGHLKDGRWLISPLIGRRDKAGDSK